ncbi:hypothetical protein PbB2_02615 [Candidatus Phycosocius bacilliformis]|uniref:Helicase HerA central domain-containing protein n=1 Tax=Candidatus Phycosocius bacilliformis TaxID=1445552 RepID=A0A2P2ECZ3_9PROT|nr:ATP-binding protein [Candidatus Phycosocius bacilliformis]GBF58925.1 hypothetical protein PbB2_02615 [Candidatus Phycosocius bacilliformis]
MTNDRLQKESVLRVGEVSTVSGRRISITVDKDKNLSELFFDGELIRNIAVGSYVEIRKGFLSLIGKVDGENAQFESAYVDRQPLPPNSNRVLTVSLVGFLNHKGMFFGGTKELPLVGNEAYLLTKDKIHQIHNLIATDGIALHIATSEYEGYDIALPVDGLMNSHIAIFGNTGSGKSNTLAMLFQAFIAEMRSRNSAEFNENCRVILFDFNGEYARPQCLTTEKTVYRLSTRNNDGDKLPLTDAGLMDIEILSILADATEKTQQPFLKRALHLQRKVMEGADPQNHVRNIVKLQVKSIMQMSDKQRVDLLFDYLRKILPEEDAAGERVEIAADIDWHNQSSEYKLRATNQFLKSNPDLIEQTMVFNHVDALTISDDPILLFIMFCYIQLIYDVLSNRAQNEHIAPAINKLLSKQADIRKIFDDVNGGNLFTSNIVVISLNDVNIEMRKTIPLLIARKIYNDHKAHGQNKTLNIVIDEAHNILSLESARESESWKDYRLETFEEIIKEGRKFGVFMTIASQRPNDISHTITSQAHNYFIHRLVNQKDLQAIASAVSYIDKLTEESIPTLPTGTCIFSGIAASMPLKLQINPLSENEKPASTTFQFSSIATAI